MLFKIKNLQRYLRSQIEVKTLKIFFKTNLKRKILKYLSNKLISVIMGMQFFSCGVAAETT